MGRFFFENLQMRNVHVHVSVSVLSMAMMMIICLDQYNNQCRENKNHARMA